MEAGLGSVAASLAADSTHGCCYEEVAQVLQPLGIETPLDLAMLGCGDTLPDNRVAGILGDRRVRLEPALLLCGFSSYKGYNHSYNSGSNHGNSCYNPGNSVYK